MRIFNPIIDEIKRYKRNKSKHHSYREFQAGQTLSWPEADKRNIILMPELAVEFGSPEKASVSFVVWTGDEVLVNDERITLIGPDLSETPEKQNPFGKIVIAGVKGFDETNAFNRNREIYLKKFDLALKGHMLKSASHYMAEWNRISKSAVKDGFSFSHLGNSLISEYKKLGYVEAVEVIFVTSSDDDVTELYDLGNRSTRMIKAMSKMVDEMSYDCSECSYQDLCDEAGELRKLRDELKEKKEGFNFKPGVCYGN